MQFLVFLVATIRAVDLHADLLRASIASAANDHRLGANEAPPAIISIFLGKMLTDILEQVEKGLPKRTIRGGTLDLGAKTLPHASAPLGRPQPDLAVRLHGQQVRVPRRGLERQHRVAQHGAEHDRGRIARLRATQLEKAVGAKPSPARLQQGVLSVLKRVIKEHKRVIFDGDNYSEEWHAEADRRGLPNLKDSVAAFQVLRAQKNSDLFRKYGVLTRSEYESRIHIAIEKYVKQLGIEAETMVLIAQVAAPAGRAGAPAPGGRGGRGDQGCRRRCGRQHAGAAGVRGAGHAVPCPDRRGGAACRRTTRRTPHRHAAQIARELKPAMARLRETGDALEAVVAGGPVAAAELPDAAVPEMTAAWTPPSRAERSEGGMLVEHAPFARAGRLSDRRSRVTCVLGGPPCGPLLGQQKQLGRAFGRGQHSGHRLERHHLLGRRVGIEVDGQRLDQRRPIGPRQRVQPGMRIGDTAVLQPNPYRAIQPAGHRRPAPSSIGSLRRRLSPCGVIAPNRSLPRSLRR